MQKATGMNGEEEKQRGNVLFAEREFEKAKECYEKAQALGPANPIYFFNHASVFPLISRSWRRCFFLSSSFSFLSLTRGNAA
jgi:hypothetical protein